MSLVFTFLDVTNQAKTLTLDKTLDFQKKLIGEKGIGFEKLDMAKKSDFTKNKLVEDKN